MDHLQRSMANAQAAANEETKSSAGDKYETSRAMGQLEKDMYARQLSQASMELASAISVECSVINDGIKAGTMVLCEGIRFFIFAGIGKMDFQDQTILVISPNAPLAQSLISKSNGDKIMFNQKETQILEYF